VVRQTQASTCDPSRLDTGFLCISTNLHVWPILVLEYGSKYGPFFRGSLVAITITTIPAPYRPGFASIKQLSPDTFELIASALEKAPLAGGLKELTAAVVQQVPVLKQQEIKDIIRAVFSLGVFMTDEDTPLSENLSNLSRAMQTSDKPELTLSDHESAAFEKRLERLLTIKTVVISSKVQRLRLEYPVTFHDAMILTDMRPVFDKPEERPVGCAISHTLEITYHEHGDHKEFFVVLDDDDLETIKKAIQRAEVKSASMKSLLKVANLPDLS
jgi:hypothetical protein